jgi:hypothetical protein
MPVLCHHTEESLHNETRSEIRHFIACSKSMIISSRTAESVKDHDVQPLLPCTVKDHDVHLPYSYLQNIDIMDPVMLSP